MIVIQCVFYNKLDEDGSALRNKARLITKEYNPQEGINFKETYAHVARSEAIRMLLLSHASWT